MAASRQNVTPREEEEQASQEVEDVEETHDHAEEGGGRWWTEPHYISARQRFFSHCQSVRVRPPVLQMDSLGGGLEN